MSDLLVSGRAAVLPFVGVARSMIDPGPVEPAVWGLCVFTAVLLGATGLLAIVLGVSLLAGR